MVGAEYSTLDRVIHRLAFRTIGLQKVLAELEDDLFEKQLQQVDIAKPVFVTSLPRAGTTLLLNLLSQLPDFATHTYRNMPFILFPMLWDRLTRSFYKEEVLKERAHGDGVAVGYDSPEAFEEMLWKAFWPKKYADRSIELWGANDESEDFRDFFRSHMAKIIVLASGKENPSKRYLSKNNGNISRIPYLKLLFGDGKVVIPFRNPADHVASLKRQHKNFSSRHEEDEFARDYMAGIGHFDFGANLKPFDFDNWFSEGADLDPFTDEFWLAYWNAAFAHLQAHVAESAIWVDYDQLCRQPFDGLSRLSVELDIKESSCLSSLAGQLRSSQSASPVKIDASKERLDRAAQIYDSLKGLSIIGH